MRAQSLKNILVRKSFIGIQKNQDYEVSLEKK